MSQKKQNNLLKKHLQSLATLPEQDKLFKEKYPSGGIHKHDENNPFGLHRHYVDEDVDGAHVHSPQNPGGEHAHGELKGVALIDGKHYHDGNGLGWHHHCDHEENYGEIPVEKPGQVLPEPKQSTPPREDS